MKKERRKEPPRERFKKRPEKTETSNTTKPEKSTGFQRGKKYDKSPTARKPREASKTKDKDGNYRCFKCKQIGHFIRDCPEEKALVNRITSLQENMEILAAYILPEEEALNKQGASQAAQM